VLRASVVHGLLWALWHLFMFQIVGVSLAMLAALVPFFVAGSVLFTWVYNRTGGSLLLAVLAHAGAHINNTNRPLPGNLTPALIHTAALAVAAAVLVARDPSLGSRRAD
jgi:membrane protease YdiL (CAAX protease family)